MYTKEPTITQREVDFIINAVYVAEVICLRNDNLSTWHSTYLRSFRAFLKGYFYKKVDWLDQVWRDDTGYRSAKLQDRHHIAMFPFDINHYEFANEVPKAYLFQFCSRLRRHWEERKRVYKVNHRGWQSCWEK